MGMKHFNAYTPSRRNMTVSDFAEITKKTPEKSLLAKKKEKAKSNKMDTNTCIVNSSYTMCNVFATF